MVARQENVAGGGPNGNVTWGDVVRFLGPVVVIAGSALAGMTFAETRQNGQDIAVLKAQVQQMQTDQRDILTILRSRP